MTLRPRNIGYIYGIVAIVVGLGTIAYFLRSTSAPPRPTPDAEPAADWFVDRAAITGLDFTHVNGMSGKLFFPEIMGPGVGLLDFDNDGDLDVFLPQGRLLGTDNALSGVIPPREEPSGRLFRNDLTVRQDGFRTLRFVDVTESAGIRADGYGMGIAVADYDNDGWVDIFLTYLGRDQLFRNNGDGTFTDVSSVSGLADAGWGVSAVWFDYDGDGWLDLFVGRYVNYTTETNIRCQTRSGIPDYCAPFVYPAQPSRLYRNRGNGTFVDTTGAAGLSREFGPALGAVAADFNDDGWPDLYVANDLQPNQLWMNQRDGTFVNTALLAGVAVGFDGAAKSSMGVDAGDFDNDGDEDIFVTELTGQGADLYVNDGAGLFHDQSASSGLRLTTLPYTGFGTHWFDFDRDGWLDLLTVNGTVMRSEATAGGNDPFPFGQRKQLLRNVGGGRFEDVTAQAGAVFDRAAVGRGAAFGDIDNDGDIDVVVGNTNGAVELLINEVRTANHWIGLRLASRQPARDMVGARVAIVRADGVTHWRRVRSDGSYASASDVRVLVGLGRSDAPVTARVTWPGGRSEEWRGIPLGRYTTLTEGSGTATTGTGMSP